MKGAAKLQEIIRRSSKKDAHAKTAAFVRQFLERGEMDEVDDEAEIEALKEIQRYHERLM